MGRDLNPKCKQCRRAGEKLMLKGDKCNTQKCPMVSRNYPPGIHGPRLGRRQRLSDYAMQLKEKQKAKKQYRLMEKQFKIIFEKAGKKKGDIGKNFLAALELRLDNVVYRLGLASSRDKARQIVNHGHIQVNDKKVSIPSYEVKEGDVIGIKKTAVKKKEFKGVSEKLKKYEAPGWLHLDKDNLSGKVLHSPDVEELERNINTQMIVEHYSK
jgi:small subunit ribosomal protein S4